MLSGVEIFKFFVSDHLKGLKNRIHTAVRRSLEETLEVKTFLKMSIELRFCSILGPPVLMKKDK